MGVRAPLLALALVAGADAAEAADDAGLFAIKGAGLQDCAAFIEAVAAGSPDLALYAGWIDGYVTALNQFTPDAFDFAPWQNAQTMLGLTQSVCSAAPPETRFMDAFADLARILAPHRLTAQSPIEAVQVGGRGALVYRAVVAAAQTRLAALGHYEGAADGAFDEAVSAALAAFQRAEGLEAHGLPDQPTLFALLLKDR